MSKDQEKQEEKQETSDGQLDDDLVGEIESAAEQVAEESKRPDDSREEGSKKPDETISGKGGNEHPPKPDDNTEGQEQEQGEEDGKNTGDGVPDDIIERAVKAGMSIADAKSFASAPALERFCSLLESRSQADGKPGEGGKQADEKGSDDHDPSSDIPDLDPDKYDENIVAGFKAMKDIIGKQFKTIRDLKSGEAQSRSASEFGSLLESKTGIDEKSRPAIEAKYNFLSKAYKADGVDVKPSDVLDEAIAIVIGNEAGKRVDKVEKLESRSKLHIQRPSKAPGKPTADPWSDVAAEVEEAFSGKP